jgi:hypothetical protein
MGGCMEGGQLRTLGCGLRGCDWRPGRVVMRGASEERAKGCTAALHHSLQSHTRVGSSADVRRWRSREWSPAGVGVEWTCGRVDVQRWRRTDKGALSNDSRSVVVRPSLIFSHTAEPSAVCVHRCRPHFIRLRLPLPSLLPNSAQRCDAVSRSICCCRHRVSTSLLSTA